MPDFIKETQTVWEKLAAADKPIVLYGMGNGAEKILDRCQEFKVPVAGIFASDDFVRGQSFRGFKVARYAEIVAELGKNILIVVAFASEKEDVLQTFAALAKEHEVLVPHLPIFAEDDTVSPAWFEKYAAELQLVYDRLGDEQSRRVFAAALNYKISGKPEYLFGCATDRRTDLRELLTWNEDESYMDLGAYDGDTLKEFSELTGGHWLRAIAVEPDRRNFAKLCRSAAALPPEKIVLLQKGVWHERGTLMFSDSGGRQSTFRGTADREVEVDSVDNMSGGEKITYIKLDVEGVEVQALQGAAQTLSRFTPKLLLAAYHYDNDLFRLPLFLWEIVPEYKIYLRKHPYVPCWELNFICKRD